LTNRKKSATNTQNTDREGRLWTKKRRSTTKKNKHQEKKKASQISKCDRKREKGERRGGEKRKEGIKRRVKAERLIPERGMGTNAPTTEEAQFNSSGGGVPKGLGQSNVKTAEWVTFGKKWPDQVLV